jgi:hypothetical protein
LNQDMVLVILNNSPETAKSAREIAQDLGLDISSYVNWIRAERGLCRALRKLVKWDLADCDYRQNAIGQGFWYGAYWRTELGRREQR